MDPGSILFQRDQHFETCETIQISPADDLMKTGRDKPAGCPVQSEPEQFFTVPVEQDQGVLNRIRQLE